MKEKDSITQDNFALLLQWLDRDEEIAAAKYEAIRRRLIRVFFGRGCYDAEAMADLTIDRVTLKVSELADSYDGDPALYFLGVARNVLHEWFRNEKKLSEARIPPVILHKEGEAESEREYDCLETCLSKLAANVREMIIEYYRKDRGERIRHRRELAAKLGISIAALQTKAFRVRIQLSKCVRRCAMEIN